MASKSKRRRRVFRASCILAALIIAGSSFAWFTSKDEVTNRLSANADYDVSIVESFAPPKNFLPGQKVNKDVYAVNTGTIGAFVKESVTTQLSITKEVPVTTTLKNDAEDDDHKPVSYWGVLAAANPLKYKENGDTELADCIELDYDEIYVTEAGSYLALKPYGSKAADLGDLVVDYNDQYDPKTKTYQYVATVNMGSAETPDNQTKYLTEDEYNAGFPSSGTGTKPDGLSDEDWAKYQTATWKKVEVPPSKTDFTPDVEGLYVFRRAIDVDKMNAEEFDYAAYYYKDGHYYKVDNLAVTPDENIDLSNDGVTTDGQLASATFDLVKEVTEVVVPTLTYDKANNRLIATYGGYADNAQNNIINDGDAGTDNDLDTLAHALDEAEHEWVEARAALEAALNEKAASDANVAKDMAAIQALQAELDKVNARISELTDIIDGNASKNIEGYSPKVTAQDTLANTTDKSALQTALTNLYGDSNANAYTYTLNNLDTDDKITFVEADTDTTENVSGKNVSDSSKYYKYLDAKEKYEAAKTAYAGDKYNAYLAELKAKYGAASGGLADADDRLALNATNDLDTAIEIIGYEILKENIDYPATNELHDLYTKSVDFLKAELEYKQAKKAAEDAFKTYKKDSDLLGNGKTSTPSDPDQTEQIAGYTIEYKKSTVVKDGDNAPVPGDDNTYGMRKQLAELKAEKLTLESKKTALEGAIDAANRQAVTDATYTGTTGTAADNLATAKTTYNNAYKSYVAAQNAYNKRKAEYDAAKNLKIYINLADVVTEGGIANKWQIVPVGTIDVNTTDGKNDTAEFFYTSILPAGATSSKLIDSVELDEGTTQDMYKSFDFDINVSLDSRQIAYTQNDPTVIETKQLAGFGADVILDDYHSENAVLTWSEATGTTYSATAKDSSNNDLGSVTVTKVDTANAPAGMKYKISLASGDYFGTSTANGTTFTKYTYDDESSSWTSASTAITLTSDATVTA